MPAVNVEVAARKFALPHECPCCGAVPDTELRVPTSGTGHVPDSARALDFPYCKRCVGHVHRYETSGVPSAAIMLLAIVAAIVFATVVSIRYGVIVFVAGACLGWWLRTSRRNAAKAACGPSCAATGRAVEYRGWTGTTSAFTFSSPTFAARFAEANQTSLANVSPQLRKLIDGYHKARLAVPTPAAAAGVVPPPLNVREWLARIESTEGVVARRVALKRALEMIEEPQPRRELIQTVAQIELAPVLDQLQHQSSPTAKKALLRTTIERIRADNIPDELEAAEVEKLEARLAELG